MENIDLPKPGFYYHYKHDPKGPFNNYSYEVIGIGRNTEEKSLTVIYRPLYESEWMKPANYQSRPLEMFIENVEKDGKTVKRFTPVTDQKIIDKLQEIKNKLYV